jgi:hypothetical protein
MANSYSDKFSFPIACSGLALAIAFSAAGTASAAKRLSYEEAFAKCKEEISKTVPGENAGTPARYAAGGACMTRYGFRLKKKDSF